MAADPSGVNRPERRCLAAPYRDLMRRHLRSAKHLVGCDAVDFATSGDAARGCEFVSVAVGPDQVVGTPVVAHVPGQAGFPSASKVTSKIRSGRSEPANRALISTASLRRSRI